MWQKPKRHCSPQVFNHQGCSWGIVLTAGQAGILALQIGKNLLSEKERQVRKEYQNLDKLQKKISSFISHFCYFLSVSPQALITLQCSTGVDGQLQYFPSALLPGRWTSSLKLHHTSPGLMGINIATQKRGNTVLSMKILYQEMKRKPANWGNHWFNYTDAKIV